MGKLPDDFNKFTDEMVSVLALILSIVGMGIFFFTLVYITKT